MHKVLEPSPRKPSLSELAQTLHRRALGLQLGVIAAFRAFRSMSRFGQSFIICVIVPTLIAGFYLTFVASRMYVSEAQIAVRKPADANSAAVSNAATVLSTLSTSTGAATQDTFIVSNYIKSRSIIEDLGGKSAIEEIFSRPDIDWFSRLTKFEPIEKIWRYWKWKVSVTIDAPSGIISLEAYAFRPEDAKNLAGLIIKHSELLVNQISERSRNDAVQRASSEVELAQQKLKQARAEMLDYRNKSSLLDPRLNTTTIGATIQQLLKDKFTLENDAASVRGSMSSNSPTLQILDARIANINKQIASLREQLTNQNENSALSKLMAGYEERQLRVLFAEKIYAISETSYVKAREEQSKQQLYLVTIVRPTTPEEHLWLRPLILTSLTFALCLILWSMVSLIWASIRDHLE